LFAVGFGDVDALHCLRAIGAVLERLFDLAQESADAAFGSMHLLDAESIHAGRAAVGGYPFPRRA
jgi:hypothetical protein